MKKPVSLIAVSVLILICVLSVKAVNPDSLKPVKSIAAAGEVKKAVQENVFEAGESISFGIFSYGIRVGSGSLIYKGPVSEDGRFYQHVIFQASSFSIKDEEDILGTEDFSYPVRVKRDIRRLGKNEVILEDYSDDRKSVVVEKAIDGKKEPVSAIKKEKELQNILLLIYNLRNSPMLDVGQTYDIQLPTIGITLEVKRRVNIKVPLGKQEAFYIESIPAKYRIWLGSDKKRIPVKIQGVVGAGMVYLAATEVKNVKK